MDLRFSLMPRPAASSAAVLMRIPDLARIGRDELHELVVEAWLTRAQKRVAKAWLSEHEAAED